VSEVDDRSLSDRLARGDRDALAAIYAAHGSVVFAVIVRLVRDRAEAEELVQEHKNRPNYNPEEMKKDLHLWYARNGQDELVNEMKSLLQSRPQIV
jgi:hypothetical protein